MWLIYRAPMPTPPTPRVLGVNDWARRRGQTYGIVFVDLERHAVVDLLAYRSADDLAAWLAAHPGVEIIRRNCAECYADGARRGAPDAVQVADRWHLLRNVRDVLERVLQRHRLDLREAARRSTPRSTRCTRRSSPFGRDPVAEGLSLHPKQARGLAHVPSSARHRRIDPATALVAQQRLDSA